MSMCISSFLDFGEVRDLGQKGHNSTVTRQGLLYSSVRELDRETDGVPHVLPD